MEEAMSVRDFLRDEVFTTEFWFWKLCIVVGFGGFIILQVVRVLT